ncbi:MAG TPA: ATP-dependent zinc metalloprotease FtsH [Anaerolineae bacterium]|nr:ATP-dependent zinc metalloprotease FtsH [Anaerolineae bacterium]
MNKQLKDKQIKFSIGYVIAAILILTLIQTLLGPMFSRSTELSYTDFKAALRAGEIESVSIGQAQITGVLKAKEGEEGEEGQTFTTVRVEDPNLLEELEAQNVEIRGHVESEGSFLGTLLGWILPLVLMFGFYYFMLKRMRGGAGGVGGGLFSFGKSKARVIQGEQTGVTFKDVGGAGEAATELQEIIDFLKNPARFQKLGGKIPKGVLLVGPPGTGKTLLAKATAGEANVPFYSLSGSEFVEMFVGVGASRVRDLFEQAKKTAPCIVFIDEIDAIGAKRAGAGAMGVHEEREQTLNQLLAEMDGFESSHSVIVMAATNRPEVLDPALLRPGRFDRQISVDLPDLVGRAEILRIHARNVLLADNTDMTTVARITPGFSGADLANVVNEAALLAARQGKAAIEMTDFDAAIERVIAGSERRTRTMNEQEKRVVAYHEAGHALIASLLPGVDPVHKVTIVPHGRALGYTMQRPTEDRYLMSENELRARLAVMLGGRVAEALVFDEVSTGAADDLARATDLARRMVTEYGMSPALGPVRLAAEPQAAYLGPQLGLDGRVSPQTSARVDDETRRIVEEARGRAWDLLEAHRPALDTLAHRLCERETIDGQEVATVLAETVSANEPKSGPAVAVTAG